MNSTQYLNEHRIVLSVIVTKPKEEGEELYNSEGIMCGYYVPEGYMVHSAYVRLRRSSLDNLPHFIRRVIDVVCYLNPEHSYDVLWGYIEMIIKERLGALDGVVCSAMCSMMKKYFDDRWGGDYDLEPEVRKYYWTFPISSDEKLSVRTSHRNRRMGERTAKEIEEAIYNLDARGLFVTQREISHIVNKSLITVKRHMSDYFRELIQEVNLKKFKTDNWNTYIKHTNTDTIVRVIDEIKQAQDRMSKSNISKKSMLSYNTVSNLWQEDRVQDALNEYNQYIKSL